MDAERCKRRLDEALETHGKPEILNIDQGSQFTFKVFANYVIDEGIRFSMDGNGRAIKNAFIERLGRSVKYEKLYLNPPNDGTDLYLLLAVDFNYYKLERRHSGIDDQIPELGYFQLRKKAA